MTLVPTMSGMGVLGVGGANHDFDTGRLEKDRNYCKLYRLPEHLRSAQCTLWWIFVKIIWEKFRFKLSHHICDFFKHITFWYTSIYYFLYEKTSINENSSLIYFHIEMFNMHIAHDLDKNHLSHFSFIQWRCWEIWFWNRHLDYSSKKEECCQLSTFCLFIMFLFSITV